MEVPMIVLAGTIAFDPERSDDMLGAVATVVEATRAEEGCLEYVIAADPLVVGQLNLFERWESDEHLGAHRKADHSRTFQRSLRDCGMAGVSIDRYEVSGVTKML
jgi:quinol monooxygenase YgiN